MGDGGEIEEGGENPNVFQDLRDEYNEKVLGKRSRKKAKLPAQAQVDDEENDDYAYEKE